MLDFFSKLGLFGVFLASMVPVFELRASIPLGLACGMPLWAVFIVAVIGNMIPVPFIILFIKKIFEWMKQKSKFLGNLAMKMEAKAAKHEDLIKKYASIGLLILVAIPLPGTGAWTGSLVAAMFDIELKKAVPIILCGVIIAGVIVSLISCGVIALF